MSYGLSCFPINQLWLDCSTVFCEVPRISITSHVWDIVHIVQHLAMASFPRLGSEQWKDFRQHCGSLDMSSRIWDTDLPNHQCPQHCEFSVGCQSMPALQSLHLYHLCNQVDVYYPLFDLGVRAYLRLCWASFEEPSLRVMWDSVNTYMSSSSDSSM